MKVEVRVMVIVVQDSSTVEYGSRCVSCLFPSPVLSLSLYLTSQWQVRDQVRALSVSAR